MAETRVKGSVILSRVDFVRQQGALDAVRQALSNEDRAMLDGVLPAGWYDLSFNRRLDDTIAQVISPDDPTAPFLDMGRASADLNLTAHHAAFVDPGNPHTLLAAAPRIYRLYYDQGSRTYEKVDATHAILRTFDAPLVYAQDCLTVVGWHERAIALCGGKNARVEETKCRARGDAHCEYACSWTI